MENKIKAALHRPHDTYFEQVFKVLPVALQLIKRYLPAEQLEMLDLSTLQLSSESFISEDLEESLSDLIYTCKSFWDEQIRICLLFEHKSNSTGRKIYPQYLRYISGVQIEDISQNRPFFSLSIPILFYHGSGSWSPGPLNKQYGKVPEILSGYIPNFDFVFINLQEMSDETIFAMQDNMLLRNIFLAFKHARDDNFFRQYYREVFIFAEENESEEILLSLFQSTFTYIQIVSSINKIEIMQMVQTLPPQYERTAKSTYEQFVEGGREEGIEIGMEKGMEKGMENLIRNLMTKRPLLSNSEIADMLDVNLQLVIQVRNSL